MNYDKFEPLINNAGKSLSERFSLLQEKAEHLIAEQVEVMKERGDAVELGEDELRLLKSYRNFKARSKPGTIFSWTTPVPEVTELVIPQPNSGSLILDPRECSSLNSN